MTFLFFSINPGAAGGIGLAYCWGGWWCVVVGGVEGGGGWIRVWGGVGRWGVCVCVWRCVCGVGWWGDGDVESSLICPPFLSGVSLCWDWVRGEVHKNM